MQGTSLEQQVSGSFVQVHASCGASKPSAVSYLFMQVWDRRAASYRKVVAVSDWYMQSIIHFCSDTNYCKILTKQTLNKFYIYILVPVWITAPTYGNSICSPSKSNRQTRVFLMSAMSSPTTEQLQSLLNGPALAAPPGVLPNFSDPPSSYDAAVAINIVFLVLSTLTLATRIYTKVCIMH